MKYSVLIWGDENSTVKGLETVIVEEETWEAAVAKARTMVENGENRSVYSLEFEVYA